MHSPSRRLDWGTVLLVGLPVLIAASFFTAFGMHSYHPSDHGWLLAYAWRVAGGQTPYVDFVYRRPPGSIYLHAIWMWLPDGWAFLSARLTFYLQLAFSGGLVALSARRIGLARSSWKLALLGIPFTAIAIHNFPVMAWNTVDGVFFCSAGLAALLMSFAEGEPEPARFRRALAWRSGASALFALSVLCKQPFAFAGLAFGLLTGAELVWERAIPWRLRVQRFVASAAPALAIFVALAAWLGSQGALAPMFEQISIAGGHSSVLDIGVASLLTSHWLWIVLPAMAWPWLAARNTAQPPILAGAAALIGAAVIWYAVQRGSVDGHIIFFVLLGITLGRALLWLADRRAGRPQHESRLRLLLAAGVLIMAWCASLSWGYRSPLLGLAPMAVVVEDLVPPNRHKAFTACLLALFAALVLSNVVERNLTHPYRDLRIDRQTVRLENIFPRFGRVTSNLALAVQMSELRELVTQHALAEGRAFTVLDEFPLIHYLVDEQNPALMDWYWASERQGMHGILLEQLLELDAVFLLYRGEAPSPYYWIKRDRGPCLPTEFEEMPLKAAVYESSRLIASGRFFCVVEIGSRGPESSEGGVGTAKDSVSPR